VDHVPLLPKLGSELAAKTCELRHPKRHERRLYLDGNSGQAVMRAPSSRRGEGWGEVAWSLEAKPLTRSLTRSGLFPRGKTRREKRPQRFHQSRTSSSSSPILPLHVADSPPPCRSSIGQTSCPLAAQDNAISARRRFAVPRTRCGMPCRAAEPGPFRRQPLRTGLHPAFATVSALRCTAEALHRVRDMERTRRTLACSGTVTLRRHCAAMASKGDGRGDVSSRTRHPSRAMQEHRRLRMTREARGA